MLARSRHAVAELALHDVADGTPRGAVPLPGPGSLTGLSVADRDTPAEAGRLWIGWTDFVTPSQVHRYENGETVLEAAAPGAVAVPAVRSAQRTFTSADGTTVRMFVLAPDADSGPRPTLVTGYGGFGISREPAYSAAALAWVEAGGCYAVVSLRGGGEEGDAWHLAGNRANKQNVFDDFHAACDALVSAGTTTTDQLSIMGGSNGGLLVGAALTQRPDAYRAVVCSAPLLDMVRYEEFSLGRTWNDEYGTAADPEELGWLLSYSPYHHVRAGHRVPGGAVHRVRLRHPGRPAARPQDVRRPAARHQGRHPTTRPILLRRETDVGHGARSVTAHGRARGGPAGVPRRAHGAGAARHEQLTPPEPAGVRRRRGQLVRPDLPVDRQRLPRPVRRRDLRRRLADPLHPRARADRRAGCCTG